MKHLPVLIALLAAACSSPGDSSTTTPDTAQSTNETMGAAEGQETETEVGSESESSDPTPAPQTGENLGAEQGYKNLQVVPTLLADGWGKDDLKDYMKSISTDLGVTCDFCHEMDDLSSDEQKHKQIARNMMLMVKDLNKSYFPEQKLVSCGTCHQGNEHPPK